MRKLLASALMTALCIALLVSCSAGASVSETVREIQDTYRSAGKISGITSVSANYGDRAYDYRVSFEITASGGTLEILEPEEIAGVTAKISGGGATLSFDGAEVYAGEILPDDVSPLSAIPLMADIWKNGLSTESVKESLGGADCISVSFRVSDDVFMRTWFDMKTHLPVQSEFVYGGYSVMTCRFDNVIVE